MLGELEKLEANLGGVADLKRQPDALFVLDLRKEQIAVREGRRLGLPIIGLVDTNCDPDEVDLVIPGNDDAIRSCSLIVRAIGDAIEAGKQGVTVQEFEQNGQKAEPAPETEQAPAADEAPVEHEPMAAAESAAETEAAEAAPEGAAPEEAAPEEAQAQEGEGQ
jgi:small subunit ribosomal protein S2